MKAASTFYYGWIVVAAGVVGNMVFMGATYASFGLFVLPLSQEFGLSRADANTALVILNLGMAFQAPFVGRLLDRASVPKVMMVGACLFSLSLVGLALSPLLPLDVAILLLPLPFAMMAACSLAIPVLIVRWFSIQTARAMVIAQMGFSLGSAVSAPLTALLIEGHGWRMALLVIGIVVGAILACVALVMRDRPGAGDIEPGSQWGGKNAADGTLDPPAPAWTVRELLGNAQFWIINLSGALVLATSTAFSISLAPFARGEGLSLTQAAMLISAMSTSGIVGKFVLAVIGDRVSKIMLLVGIYLGGAVATAFVVVADDYAMLLVSVAPLGLVAGMTSALLNAVVADHFGRASFGTVTGLAQPIQAISTMVAMRFAGEVFDRTGGYELLLFAIIAVKSAAGLAMILMFYGRPSAARRVSTG
ncbi:MAG TPA: MFS transporter [Novosphingobium sp.]|nr:MFS transporter [Novosphingobium sp.]